MSNTRQKKSKGPFGLSPLTLFLGACLLVLLGVAGGIGLDLALRPVLRPSPHARRDVPAPVIATPAEENSPGATPSILARPLPGPRPAAPTPDSAVASTPAAPLAHAQEPVIAFAMPSPMEGPTPAIAIVIDDMGLDRTRTMEVLALPPGVTVSLMTYADDVGTLAASARAAGHEVLAHVPMQPLDAKQDPGPHALTVAMDDAAIRATLTGDLDHWQGYVGINNHMGSRFTMDKERMAAVMAELKARGLLWLDSRTTTESVGPAAAQAAGVPYVTRDIFLDNVETVPAVLEQLEHAVALAKTHRTAIAIGHPHATTIAALKQFLPTLADRGVSLVPITEILKRQQAHAHPS